MQIRVAFRFLSLTFFCLALALPGCALESEAPSTIASTPLPMSVPAVLDTPLPTSVKPQLAIGCENESVFLEDLTIPDFTTVLPGEDLHKRWSVQNSGTCDWGPDYRLLRLGLDSFEGPLSLALYPARAGSTAVWEVDLKAPLEPGSYVSQWQAQAPDGSFFGEVVYILVLVENPTPTPTATPLISPTPN
ncbi:MAG: hypothetical protein GTO14_25790 [Anaerolineales bacterium]|nr:hypothetical protein [Anaerolineales bacterium]